MRVKSIVIDGFKSYAHRQELADMDPHFNAITGLNGSGKSNVFDAICFVMGLRNVAKVRVEREVELLFKNGKAGIQRASVTIEFDNRDPATAPEHYPPADYPTITITRQIDSGLRHRFFFNGRACDKERIREFFMFASLNIDNPHFLVQQGQVHRLVGMKPSEVLGFVEEAAGTSIFDHARRRAELQMRNKEKRLQEISEALDQEIGPRLLVVEEQGRDYARFVQITEGIEGRRRFRAAYEVWSAEAHLQEAEAAVAAIKERVAIATAGQREATAAIVELEAQVQAACDRAREPEEALKRALEEQRQGRVAVTGLRTEARAATEAARTATAALEKAEAEDRKAREHYEALSASSAGSVARRTALTEEMDRVEKLVMNLRQALRLRESGVDAGIAGVSLVEELAAVRRALVELDGRRDELTLSIKQAEREVADADAEMARSQKQHGQREADLATAQARVEQLAAALGPAKAALQEHRALEAEVVQLRAKEREASDRVATKGPIAPLQFSPIPGVEMGRNVFGRLGELVRVRDPDRFSYALSAAAGLNLTRIVVSEDHVAQMLLERGGFTTRVSCWPLNVVQSGGGIDAARERAIQDAARGAGGDVWLASSLVEYDPRYGPVMEKVFGTFVVCSSMAVARAVAHSDRCRVRAVTLDGDTVEPSGLISGGARGAMRDFLAEFQAMTAARAPLDAATAELRAALQRLEKLRPEIERARPQQRELEEQQLRVDALRKLLDASPHADSARQRAKIVEDAERMRAELATGLPAKQRALELRQAEIVRLQGDNDPIAAQRALRAQLDEAEARSKQVRKDLATGGSAFERDTRSREAAKARMDDAANARAEAVAAAAASQGEAAAVSARLEAAAAAAKQASDTVLRLQEHINTELEARAQLDAALERNRATEAELTSIVTRGATDVQAAERRRQEEQRRVQDLAQRHGEWLDAARPLLGRADGPYPFEDEAETQRQLRELEEHEAMLQALSKKVNRSAQSMLEQWTDEHKKLVEQRAALLEDKLAIVGSIREVEDRKWSALDDMVRRVSGHFSDLFRICLPYATCRLHEVRDSDTGRLVGLEVKVAFNGQEKESLTELSGGQRSLLALCLILAILRVHPAPVYILDEVDAALDPSHTQNLGRMLKEKFADAQFLLVSLKDGMWSNANVVFEVRNTHGYSEINRIAKR